MELGKKIEPLFPQLSERLYRRAVNDHFSSVPLATISSCMISSGFRIEHISIRDAIQRDETNLGVRCWFYIADLIFRLTFGQINFAPGVLIVARAVSKQPT